MWITSQFRRALCYTRNITVFAVCEIQSFGKLNNQKLGKDLREEHVCHPRICKELPRHIVVLHTTKASGHYTFWQPQTKRGMDYISMEKIKVASSILITQRGNTADKDVPFQKVRRVLRYIIAVHAWVRSSTELQPHKKKSVRTNSDNVPKCNTETIQTKSCVSYWHKQSAPRRSAAFLDSTK